MFINHTTCTIQIIPQFIKLLSLSTLSRHFNEHYYFQVKLFIRESHYKNIDFNFKQTPVVSLHVKMH